MMNLEELTVVMEMTSEGVKSALNSHCSIFDTPCKIDVLNQHFASLGTFRRIIQLLPYLQFCQQFHWQSFNWYCLQNQRCKVEKIQIPHYGKYHCEHHYYSQNFAYAHIIIPLTQGCLDDFMACHVPLRLWYHLGIDLYFS